MAASFGVRLTGCGPNRLGVMARLRDYLRLSPAQVKAHLNAGSIVLVQDVSMHSALQVEAELQRLGALVEVYVSTPCPCCGQADHTEG
jgi:ribosomal protein L7/L12